MPKYPHYKCGIANIGNTCFINSALQCLSRIRRFANYFKKGSFKNIENWDDQPEHLKNMCTEWEDLTSALISTDTSNIVPNRFYMLFRDAAKKEKMEWLIEGQNDSHEFMMFFIDVLHKAVSKNVEDNKDLKFVKFNGKPSSNTFPKKYKHLTQKLSEMSNANWATHFVKEYHPTLTQMFHGQFMTMISSKNTNEQSFTFEPFSSINVAVPESGAKGITIMDCLDKYFSTETMADDEQWDSPKVGKVDALRATRIWRLPDVLILSLKRFTMMGGKINTQIEFPLENLDMKRYVIGPEINSNTVYDLVGMVIHSGLLFGGHYVAIVRNPGGNWVACNDSSVTPVKINEDMTKTSGVYTLVYQKKDIMEKDDNLDRISE